MRNNSFLVLIIITLFLIFSCNNQDRSAKSKTDDAKIQEELTKHIDSIKLVVSKVDKNKLGVNGERFRAKSNPIGKGCFVYDPNTNYSGVTRQLVWWVPSLSTAYPLNSPSKLVTPSLKWAREDGVDAPTTSEVIGYVFENKLMEKVEQNNNTRLTTNKTFTVKEYKMYREMISIPMSISEEKALENIAKKYDMSTDEVKSSIRKVLEILYTNKWSGSTESEIKHASDYK